MGKSGIWRMWALRSMSTVPPVPTVPALSVIARPPGRAKPSRAAPPWQRCWRRWSSPPRPAASSPSPPELVVETVAGRHRFTVELADTPARRSRGLMFRESMPADHGMLFDFQAEQPVAFWMKNTPLPLDMVFIDDAGTVVQVAADTALLRGLDPLAPAGPRRPGAQRRHGGAARHPAGREGAPPDLRR